MKKCPKCCKSLPLEAFGVNNSKGNLGRQSYCTPCNKEYHRARYLAHKDRYREQDRSWRNAARKRNRRLLREYLEAHPCVDCGEADPVVLEFDHVSPDTKLANVSNLVSRGIHWSRVEAEISKCDVRCANCHKRRTAAQFSWYRE